MRYTSLFVVLALVSSGMFGAFMVITPHVGAKPVSTSVKVSDDNTSLKSSTDIAVTDDGKIYVVWSEQHGADYDIFFSYSTNNGTTFTSPKRVNIITSGHQQYPKIAVDDSGVVLLTWWDQSNDTGDIAFTRSLDGGESFEDEIIIHGETEGTQNYPDIAANGNRVAIIFEDSLSDNRIRIWNPVDGSPIRVLEGHTNAVRSVDFSPTGTRLASGSEDNLAKIWNPQTGNLIRNITEHTAIVTAVNWSSDGNMLATGSWDYNVTLWDTSDYSIITKLNQTDNIPLLNPVNALAFSPDGSQIAVAYNGRLGPGMPMGEPTEMFNLTVWNLSDYSNWTRNDELGSGGHQKPLGSVMDVAFSHNGTLIVSCGKDNRVRVWNSTTSFLYEQVQLSRDVLSVCWSPDDTQIAAGLDNGSIVIFNLTDSTEQYWLNSQHTGRVNALSWSEVRNEMVSGASDPKAKIWDIACELETWNLSGHTSSVYSVDWSADGSFVATAGGNSGGYQLGENQIFCVVSDDSGATFSDPSIISDSCSSTRLRPRAGIDGNGNISVVWYDRRNGKPDIYYSNSTDGLTFTQNVGVSPAASVDENIPDVSVEDNGKVHVAWQYSLGGGDIRIHYANSSDGFANYIEVSNIGQLPRICASPSGSEIWVTWRDSGLKANISTDGGLSFGDPTTIGTGMYQDSSICIDSYDQTSIAWLDWSRENIYYASSVIQDNWRPTILDTFPAHNAVEVSIFTSIYVNFSEPMNEASVEDAFSIHNTTTYLNAGDCEITWSSYGDKVNFTLRYPLDYTDNYIVTINDTAEDLSDNTLQTFYSFTFATSTDIDPPVIEHTPISEISYDEPLNINATIIDWWGTVASANLHYRGVMGTGFTMQAMTGLGNHNYTATIPAQGQLGIIEYYFTASDNHGNSGRLPINTSRYFNTTVVDGTAPEITHVPLTEHAVFQPIVIWAVVTDEVNLASVEVNYNGTDDSNYTLMQMTANGTGNAFSCTIPAQNTTGSLDYNITAMDSAGNFNTTALFSLTITDLTKPDINYVLPEYLANTTKEVIIRASVTDDVAVDEVTLYFKAVGGDSWVVRNMHHVSDDIYEFTIPAQRRSGTIYYYVNATDTSGNLASTLTEQDQYQIEVQGTGQDSTLYIALGVVLIILIIVLVYLLIRKFKGKTTSFPEEDVMREPAPAAPVEPGAPTTPEPQSPPAQEKRVGIR